MSDKKQEFENLESWLAANPLYVWRIENGIDGMPLPIRDTAEQLDVSYNSVWLWENGKFVPKYKYLTKIADVIGYIGGVSRLQKDWHGWKAKQPAITITK